MLFVLHYCLNINALVTVIICPVIIPDARKIHAAKEKRRQARAQQDYISLDSPRTPGSLKEDEKSDEEQDSDNDLDDHERRIEFAPKPKTLRERMAEKMGEKHALFAYDKTLKLDGIYITFAVFVFCRE